MLRRQHTAMLAAGCSVLVLAAPAPAVRTSGNDGADPAGWPDRRLAAQLTISCVDAGESRRARTYAAAGVGGITLLGSPATSRLRRQLTGVRMAAPHGVRPFVASDEEGGSVQRLGRVIHPLPSAKAMGRWSLRRVHAVARRYAVRMRALGVRMDLAPVADLAHHGSYVDRLRRAFAHEPHEVANRVQAWRAGMRDGGVVTVVKHWPGHGQAVDSHVGPARAPSLADLESRDMVPFNFAFAHGAPVVMVGHLSSEGLTAPGVPASASPNALRYLRARTGPDTVILTDSLTMAAASSALGRSVATAAVRSLQAGADWALACNRTPLRVVDGIRRAISSGRLPRAQAVASARRIVALKQSWGLITRPHP